MFSALRFQLLAEYGERRDDRGATDCLRQRAEEGRRRRSRRCRRRILGERCWVNGGASQGLLLEKAFLSFPQQAAQNDKRDFKRKLCRSQRKINDLQQ